MSSPLNKKGLVLALPTLVLMIFAFSITSFAGEANQNKIAPNDGQSHEFTVNLQVNEMEPYAGIQFKLALSDANNLSYTFSMSPAVSQKGAVLYKTGEDPNYFGFWCDKNIFSGNLNVGTMTVTYSGNAPQTLTITEMMIVRVNESTKTSGGTIAPPPLETISFSRAGSAKTYTVTFALAGGARTGGGELVQTVAEGGSAVAPEVTRSGYSLGGWDRAFTNVQSDLTVTARWTGGGNPGGNSGGSTSDPNLQPVVKGFPFEDVNEDDWFYDNVVYVYENNLMNGTAETVFSPKANLTRGMIVTILGRQNGADESEYPTCSFSDVDDDQYYAPYIEWGRQNDIVLGVGDNKFEPGRPVTRQELAAILQRYTGFAGFTLPETRSYSQFLDENRIADYAKDAVKMLFSAGVINGRTGNIFDPQNTATRAEAAAMIHRYLAAAGV